MEITEQGLKEEVKNNEQPQKKDRSWIKDLKLRLIENPESIVMVPHTEEGFALAQITLVTDKMVWLLRKKLGLSINPQEFEDYTQRLTQSIQRLHSLAGDTQQRLMVEDKLRLARLKRSMVIVPRTIEGKILANCVKKIDPVVMQLKAVESPDQLLSKLRLLYAEITTLNDILTELSERLSPLMTGYEKKKSYYRPTRHIRRIVRAYRGDQNEDSAQEGTTQADQ